MEDQAKYEAEVLKKSGTELKQDGRWIVREFRFIVGAEVSDVLCFVDADRNCPEGIQGWHAKRFPSNKPFVEIYSEMCRGDSPLTWPLVDPVPLMLTDTDLERVKI